MCRAISRARTSVLGGALLLFATMGSCPAARAEAPCVVATIKPVHSIVAAVMRGIAEPALLLHDGASPHAYAMRPADAKRLHRADLVVWIGPQLESFLTRPIATLARDAAVITLIEEPDILKLESRKGGLWREAEHDHGGAAGSRGEDDPHLWLDPANASTAARLVAAQLAGMDPENGAAYGANARRFADAMKALEYEIRTRLATVEEVPFLVFHDGYQYFEHRFGLNAVGSLALGPERQPGARRLYRIRRLILDRKVHCVFSEPQFQPALVEAVVRGTDTRSGELDPLGAGIDAGPDAYAALMQGLTASIRHCLSPAT